MFGLLFLAAQLAQADAPTRGVLLPAASLVGDDDATTLETNPGALGFAASDFVLVASNFEDSGRLPQNGVGLFGNLRLGSFSNAFGLQWIEPPSATGRADVTKMTFAMGLRTSREFGLGMSFHWFFSDNDRELDKLFSMDLGLTLRPLSLLGFGYVLRDVTTPVIDRDAAGRAIVFERTHDFEISVRPLGHDRFELGGGAAIGESSGDVTPHARMSLGIWRGVSLRGDVVVDEDDFNGDGQEERDVRGTAGVALDLDRAGVFGAGVFGRSRAGGTTMPGGAALGFVLGLRVGEEHYRPAPLVPRRVELIALKGEPSERELVRLLAHLGELERDADCRGVVFVAGDVQVGWASVEELRTRMRSLRNAGKAVVALITEAGMRELYLATAADRILIDPVGGVRLVGLRASVTYYKGTLDRIGVQADIVKIAEYKTAPEPLMRKESSEPAREMRESLLDDQYQRVMAAIAVDRKLTEATLSQLIDRGPYTAKEALDAKLVDEIVAPEQLEDWLDDRFGIVRVETPYDPASVRPSHWSSRPQIAVILVDGDLVDGETRDLPGFGVKMVGGNTVAKAIRDARDDPSIRAIVVRVNSPGGVVSAADQIWRELLRAQKEKPVVASLGDVAASGGYYVAAGAQRIFADPSTLTGSIGIFYGKFDVSGLLAKIGMTVESSERGKRAGMESWSRPYTDEERQVVLEKLRHYYGHFVDVVAQARSLSDEQVDSVGRGRVWTGAQARAHGLIDRTGDLFAAVEEAKRLAHMRPEAEVELVTLPEERSSLMERLVDAALGSGNQPKSSLAGALVDHIAKAWPASWIAAPDVPQARLDCAIDLR